MAKHGKQHQARSNGSIHQSEKQRNQSSSVASRVSIINALALIKKQNLSGSTGVKRQRQRKRGIIMA